MARHEPVYNRMPWAKENVGPEPLLTREWLLTNGIGGYASGTVGGACVHHGTIPSKALRETALSLSSFRRKSGDVFEVNVREDLQVSSLMLRLDAVIRAHERYIADQLRRNNIDIWRGKARFLSASEIEVR